MFVDHAIITIRSGRGGNGLVSFHSEKNIPNGGPDGGDGGNGGDVIICATGSLSTLQSYKHRRAYIADSGQDGRNKKCYGRSADDLRIAVPVGTVVIDEATGDILADLTQDGQEEILAKGGRGGKGNIHFSNSVRQAPNFARAGEAGEERRLILELKLLADVGLVGFPNVGKSTLLSVISSAKPKIADYPFTTLEPNLGVVTYDDKSFVVADIPGLIEGASQGAGLGDRFLRHIERTRLLVHVVDVSGFEGRDPIEDVDRIEKELAAYHPQLFSRPRIVVANKIDQCPVDRQQAFVTAMEKKGWETHLVCAPLHQGTRELILSLAEKLDSLPKESLYKPTKKRKIYRFEKEARFSIEKKDDVFVVSGAYVDRLVNSTNFDDLDSLSYFQRSLRKEGIIDSLKEAGVKEGDIVRLVDIEFEYYE